jgi:hypothetical protein
LRPDLIASREVIVNDNSNQWSIWWGGFVRDSPGRAGAPGQRMVRAKPDKGISITGRRPIRPVHEVDVHVTPATADFARSALPRHCSPRLTRQI